MKTLENFIKETNYHLRNFELNIDEELRKLDNNEHSQYRKNQQTSKYLTKNIKEQELIDLIHKCDNQITDACLNNYKS